ncbi:MAG: ATP-binding cassette domain-containing protein [Desulfobacterales bacterium]|nr:ATP-binding cassette domain-containing protein [Desulfobacterales bacterium]
MRSSEASISCVQRGESLAITGASGAGKSTLLNIMGTLEPPTQGVVRFEEPRHPGHGGNGTVPAEEPGHGVCVPVSPPAPGIRRLGEHPDAGSHCANEQERGRGQGRRKS